MWSRKFESCVRCGGTAYQHVSGGLCNSCYMADYRAKHGQKIARQKKKWYRANMTFLKAKLQREQQHYSGLRDAALTRDNHRCTQCGGARLLVVHHKDGNGRGSNAPNNCLSNLVTLCRACHIKAHRFEVHAWRQGINTRKTKLRKSPHKPQPISTWARHYDACVECGKTDSRHNGKGRCKRCCCRAAARA